MAEIPFDGGVISEGNLINHRPKTWKKKKKYYEHDMNTKLKWKIQETKWGS